MMCTICLSFLVSVCYADDNDQAVQGAYKTSPEDYHTTKVEVSLSSRGQRRIVVNTMTVELKILCQHKTLGIYSDWSDLTDQVVWRDQGVPARLSVPTSWSDPIFVVEIEVSESLALYQHSYKPLYDTNLITVCTVVIVVRQR